jgi:hypothetical protein
MDSWGWGEGVMFFGKTIKTFWGKDKDLSGKR